LGWTLLLRFELRVFFDEVAHALAAGFFEPFALFGGFCEDGVEVHAD